MARSLEAVCRGRWTDAAEPGRSGGETGSSDRDASDLVVAFASALSRSAEDGSGADSFGPGRSRSRASLSLSGSDRMSAEPENLNHDSAVIWKSRFPLERGRADPLF